jgi:hypothetical protein
MLFFCADVLLAACGSAAAALSGTPAMFVGENTFNVLLQPK